MNSLGTPYLGLHRTQSPYNWANLLLIGQVSCHNEIVLNYEACLLGVHDEALDELASGDSLLRVQVRRRLVKQVQLSGFAEREHQSYPL